jgi:hypothetical protein
MSIIFSFSYRNHIKVIFVIASLDKYTLKTLNIVVFVVVVVYIFYHFFNGQSIDHIKVKLIKL